MPATPRRTPSIVELRISLAEIAPPIWRQLLVPTAFTLDAVHGVIMEAFGWLDYHLYEFSFGGNRYFSPHDEEPAGAPATKTTLTKLQLKAGDRLEYTYDFGDDWQHEIDVLGFHHRAPDLPYPHCLDGARAAPPEDCGGVPGYEELLRVLGDARHEEHASMRAWVGKHYHPETFDIKAVNRILMLRFPEVARRRG